MAEAAGQEEEEPWRVFVNGSSTGKESGVALVLPQGDELKLAI